MPIPIGILAIAGAGGAGGANFMGKISGASADWGYAIKTDTSGNFYVGGYTTISSKDEFFIAKYDSTGTILWQRTLGDAYDNTVYGLDIDSSGNVYVTGRSDRTGGFEYNFQIAKYNTSGSIQWQRRLGGTSNYDIAEDVAVDSSGNVYVVGWSDATPNGFNGIFVAKYNTSGTIQWQRRAYSGAFNSFGNGISVDSSGDVYVTGRFDTDSSNLNYELVVAKWNTLGGFQWGRRLGNIAFQIGRSIAVTPTGTSYSVGYDDASGEAVIIAKYNSSGGIQWQRRLAATGSATSVAVDSSENVYILGRTSTSGYDEFMMAKYNSSGTIQWQRKLGTGVANQGEAIDVDSTDNFYITGRSVNVSSDIFFAKLPGDGSKTGTYSLDGQSFVYVATTFTDSATTYTDQTLGLTENASSLTDAATTLTDAAGTLTSTKINF